MNFGIESDVSKGPRSTFSKGSGPGPRSLYEVCYSFLCLFSFCDLVLLGMHDKLADFEITRVSFIFNAGVSSEDFDI